MLRLDEPNATVLAHGRDEESRGSVEERRDVRAPVAIAILDRELVIAALGRVAKLPAL